MDGTGFAASCNNIRWYELGTDNQGVAAECVKEDGSVGSTTLYNVERRVSNNGGILAFNSCRRRSLLESVDDASAIAGGRKLLQAWTFQDRRASANSSRVEADASWIRAQRSVVELSFCLVGTGSNLHRNE